MADREWREADQHLSAVLERLLWIRRALNADPANADVLEPALRDAWAEYRHAHMRCCLTSGMSERHADLQWRDMHRLVHPSEALNAIEREELDRLDAEREAAADRRHAEFEEQRRRCRESIEMLKEIEREQHRRRTQEGDNS